MIIRHSNISKLFHPSRRWTNTILSTESALYSTILVFILLCVAQEQNWYKRNYMLTLKLLLRTDLSLSLGFSEPVVYSSIIKKPPPVPKRVSIIIYVYVTRNLTSAGTIYHHLSLLFLFLLVLIYNKRKLYILQ